MYALLRRVLHSLGSVQGRTYNYPVDHRYSEVRHLCLHLNSGRKWRCPAELLGLD